MTFKTLIGTVLLVMALIAYSGLAHAQETTSTTDASTAITISDSSATTTDPDDITLSLTDELATIQARENDPDTGVFMKFILRFKIKELENQLNVKNALQ